MRHEDGGNYILSKLKIGPLHQSSGDQTLGRKEDETCGILDREQKHIKHSGQKT
jgi:hypothetical protein